MERAIRLVHSVGSNVLFICPKRTLLIREATVKALLVGEIVL